MSNAKPSASEFRQCIVWLTKKVPGRHRLQLQPLTHTQLKRQDPRLEVFFLFDTWSSCVCLTRCLPEMFVC